MNHNNQKKIIKNFSSDTDGNQILAYKDMKMVNINVFYMFQNISTDTEDI